MKREIKFRIWDSSRNKMYRLNENRFSFGEFEGHRAVSWEDVFAEWHEELLPLQYTGLKDKNGVEIYEGDFVWFTHSLCGKTVIFAKVEYHSVIAGFVFRMDKDDGYFTNDVQVCGLEVIGNIHEHPQLWGDGS